MSLTHDGVKCPGMRYSPLSIVDRSCGTVGAENGMLPMRMKKRRIPSAWIRNFKLKITSKRFFFVLCLPKCRRVRRDNDRRWIVRATRKAESHKMCSSIDLRWLACWTRSRPASRAPPLSPKRSPLWRRGARNRDDAEGEKALAMKCWQPCEKFSPCAEWQGTAVWKSSPPCSRCRRRSVRSYSTARRPGWTPSRDERDPTSRRLQTAAEWTDVGLTRAWRLRATACVGSSDPSGIDRQFLWQLYLDGGKFEISEKVWRKTLRKWKKKHWRDRILFLKKNIFKTQN